MFSYLEGILLTNHELPCETMIDNTTAVSYINSMGVEASTVIKLPGNYGFGVPTMEYGCCSTHPWKGKCVSRTLLLPFAQEKAHPLQKKLTLVACKLSGILSQQEAFRKKLSKSYCNPGGRVHINNIPSTSGNGCCFAVQGVLIHTKQLQHKLWIS